MNQHYMTHSKIPTIELSPAKKRTPKFNAEDIEPGKLK